MNEVVKYNNWLNQLYLKEFTSIDLNILMALCSKMRDNVENKMTFDFCLLKEISGSTVHKNQDFAEILDRTNEKLSKITCRIKTQTEIIRFVLFPTFRINLVEQTLTVRVNEDFKFVLNEITKEFTRFELKEFTTLDGKYAKNLYRLLKQWKSIGKYVVKIEEFRKLLDVPEKYSNKYVMDKVIKPSIVELQPIFKNLRCIPKTDKKRGSPIIGYEFTFDAEQVHKKTESNTEPKTPTKTTKKPVPMTKSAENYNNYPQRQYTEEFLSDLESKLLAVNQNK